MAQVTLKIYRKVTGVSDSARELVETRRIDAKSAKKLTGKRAAQIIARECPQYIRYIHGGAIVIRTKVGWMAMRSLGPTTACSYHYIWEEVEVNEG
jgi:hypothetical protein